MSDSAPANSIGPAASDTGEQLLIFRGKLTEQDVVDIQRYTDSLAFGSGLRQLITIAFLMLSICAVGSVMIVGPNIYGFGLLIVAYFVLGYLPMHRLAKARRSYRKFRDYYEETTATLSPQYVCLEDADFHMKMRWKLIGVVLDTDRGIMFCDTAMRATLWLPERILSAESRQHVVELAQQNNVRVRNEGKITSVFS